jgi:hypothetical protein
MQQVVAQQLPAGDVDAGEDRRVDLERRLPGLQLARRLVHDIDAEIDDQPGLLGDGEEILRHQPAFARMVPAHQRLEAGDGGPPAGRSAGT